MIYFNSRIGPIGNWRLRSVLVPEAHEIMHISHRGRIVHFVITGPSKKEQYHYCPMRLWFEPLGGDEYRVRLNPGGEGWSVRMQINDGKLHIFRENNQCFIGSPVSAEELPTWFENTLKKAMETMDLNEIQNPIQSPQNTAPQ